MASRERHPLRRLINELHKHGLFSTPLDTPSEIVWTSMLEVTTVYEENVYYKSLYFTPAPYPTVDL